MREARYEQLTARATKPAAPTKPAVPAKPVVPSQPVAAAPVTETAEVVGESLCGHRAISGRTCTRERGHAAKSHRYS